MLAYYLHDLDPVIFRIYDNVGPRWYGLAYVLAFICGYLLFLWLAKRGYADLPPQRVGDFITGCALFGVIIGGRLGYVFFYKPEMLREPLSILRVWEGGMSSHGGMFGLLVFTFYYAHRHKISWTNLGDNLGRDCADWFVLWALRQFHQRRTVRTHDESSLGDAIPKGTIRSSSGSRARGGGMRANRSIAHDARRDRRCGAQPTASSDRVALNPFAAPSLPALRGFF